VYALVGSSCTHPSLCRLVMMFDRLSGFVFAVPAVWQNPIIFGLFAPERVRHHCGLFLLHPVQCVTAILRGLASGKPKQ